MLLPLSLLAAPALAQLGAITGEKTPASRIATAATACRAGTPVTGATAGRSVPVTVDVPGLESLRCLVARVAGDALVGVERVSCDAPDRASDLRCELSVALYDGGLRHIEGSASSWVTAVLAGASQSELDADRIAILPDRVELAGELPSEEARTDLETIAAKRGVPVRSFGLKVRPPLDLAKMTPLTEGTGPAELHLSGVSAASALRSLTAFSARHAARPLRG